MGLKCVSGRLLRCILGLGPLIDLPTVCRIDLISNSERESIAFEKTWVDVMIRTFVACKEITGLIRKFESNMTESMPIIFVTAKADFMHATFVMTTQR
jgi:hypothetical protein